MTLQRPVRLSIVRRITLGVLLVFGIAVPAAPAFLREGADSFSGSGSFEIKEGRFLFNSGGETFTVLENSVLESFINQGGKGGAMTAEVMNFSEKVFLLPKSLSATEKGKIPETNAPVIRIVTQIPDRAKQAAAKAKKEEKDAERTAKREAEKKEREAKKASKTKDPRGGKKGTPPPPAKEPDAGGDDDDPDANWTPTATHTQKKAEPMPVQPEGTKFTNLVCEITDKDDRPALLLKGGPNVGFSIVLHENLLYGDLDRKIYEDNLLTFSCSGRFMKYKDENFALLDAWGPAASGAGQPTFIPPSAIKDKDDRGKDRKDKEKKK